MTQIQDVVNCSDGWRQWPWEGLGHGLQALPQVAGNCVSTGAKDALLPHARAAGAAWH